MTIHLENPSSRACVWMSAGVLNYKLCDRRFDCEHCPLDAALHGGTLEPVRFPDTGRNRPRFGHGAFPADRLYASGHTWLQPLAGDLGRIRMGLDGFAASLLSAPRELHWNSTPRLLLRGETVCDLEFDDGTLELGTPIVARFIRGNPGLEADPSGAITDPYGEGWIVELASAGSGALAELLPGEAAQAGSRLDLRRLRRCVALHLLAEDQDQPVRVCSDPERSIIPWRILDGSGYLPLLREVIH